MPRQEEAEGAALGGLWLVVPGGELHDGLRQLACEGALLLGGGEMHFRLKGEGGKALSRLGCAGLENQKGGMKRRLTFLKQLKDKGWNLLPLDLGGQSQRYGTQAERKFDYALRSLMVMGYQAVGFGPGDLRLDLLNLIINLDETKNPFVSANVGIVGLTVGLALMIGPIALLKLHLPIILLAASAGIWLFYVQHQYPESYWRRSGAWNFHQAALLGSSYYTLPRVLQWFTANIGLHHIHHLCSRIPNYRLQECLDENPELRRAPRLTLLESLGCARLSLWNEETGRMIGFRDLAATAALAAKTTLRSPNAESV